MDAKERHELKENDLAEFFANFGEWWSKHGNATLIVVTLCAAGYFGYSFYRSSTQQTHENAWYELAMSTSPASLRDVAQTHSIPAVQAQAYLRAGDLWNSEGVRQIGDQPVEEGNTGPEQDFADAEAMYATVLDTAEHPVFKLNALMGLADVAESQRDWDMAAKHYNEVIVLANDAAFPHFAAQAQTRLDLLPELEKPVEFAPEPVFESPATQPAAEAPGPDATDSITSDAAGP